MVVDGICIQFLGRFDCHHPTQIQSEVQQINGVGRVILDEDYYRELASNHVTEMISCSVQLRFSRRSFFRCHSIWIFPTTSWSNNRITSKLWPFQPIQRKQRWKRAHERSAKIWPGKTIHMCWQPVRRRRALVCILQATCPIHCDRLERWPTWRNTSIRINIKLHHRWTSTISRYREVQVGSRRTSGTKNIRSISSRISFGVHFAFIKQSEFLYRQSARHFTASTAAPIRFSAIVQTFDHD